MRRGANDIFEGRRRVTYRNLSYFLLRPGPALSGVSLEIVVALLFHRMPNSRQNRPHVTDIHIHAAVISHGDTRVHGY